MNKDDFVSVCVFLMIGLIVVFIVISAVKSTREVDSYIEETGDYCVAYKEIARAQCYECRNKGGVFSGSWNTYCNFSNSL